MPRPLKKGILGASSKILINMLLCVVRISDVTNELGYPEQLYSLGMFIF